MADFPLSRRTFLNGSLSLIAATRQTRAAIVPGVSTFERPYGARSLWNARPIDPELGTFSIPPENNRAYLEQSPKWGSKLFRATAADGPVVIQGRDNPKGVWVADEVQIRSVSVPHFPQHVVPASGSDGHCEIFDEESGLIHSFYRLAFDDAVKVWRAAKYTATPISGMGWGSPERPDGPRASGTPSTSGMLRAHEVGSQIVPHALAVAAHANVFKSGPAFPATMEDRNGFDKYTGQFPMGTLFMLPQSFDSDRLKWPNSRAIAQTLKTFGARLIDQTVGTFGFAGEIGSEWSQFVGRDNVWHPSWAEDLTAIRDSLRGVVSTSGWLDPDGKEFPAIPWDRMNLLSMRGLWVKQDKFNGGEGAYETTSKMFLFSELSERLSYRKVIQLRNETTKEPWFQWMGGSWYINPLPGRDYRLRAEGFGEATAGLEVQSSGGGNVLLSISDLKRGQETELTWPAEGTLTSVFVHGYPGPPSGTRLTLELI